MSTISEEIMKITDERETQKKKQRQKKTWEGRSYS